MSKKKLEVDDIDLDESLEFDDFEMGFGSIGDDRKPVSKPGKAFVKGISRGLTNRETINKIISKNIPREYSDAYKMLGDVASGGREFTADLIKETKPLVSNLANAADKFLPSNFKTTKEKLNKIKAWADEEGQSSGPSKDEMRKQGIGIELSRIFDQQQQVASINDKIDKKEKEFDRGLDMAKHKDILSVLTKLANSNERVAGYTTTSNSAWQRKSLETQFQQLFILQDILEESKKSNAAVINNLTAITKNSALPEYRKTQKDEAFLDEARRRFSGKIVDASQNFFRRGLTKMRGEIGSFVGDLGSVSSMLSMVGDMHAMDQELDPKTIQDQLTEAGSSKLGSWLLSKAGGFAFKKIKNNPKAVEKIIKGQNFLNSLQTNGSGIAKDFLEKKDGENKGGLLGGIFSYLNETFTNEKQDNSLVKYNPKDLAGGAPFTNKVSHSITDVIPGYLSRILQEQTMLRTGKDASPIKFDYRSGKFASSKEIKDSIAKSISSEVLSKDNASPFRNIMAKIEESAKLTDRERSEIANALLKKSSNNESLMPSSMTDEENWYDYINDSKTIGKLVSSLKETYGTDSDKEFLSFNHDFQKKSQANEFMRDIRDLKYFKKDLRTKAQYHIDNGNQEEARAAGLLDENYDFNESLIDKNSTNIVGSFSGKGRTTIDRVEEYANSAHDYDGQDKGLIQGISNQIAKLIKGSKDEPDTSDEFSKDHIKPPSDVLDSISRLKIKKWKYKPGIEDGGESDNMGPMAQDLQNKFGDEVAPGGKKVNLITSNGIALKGIQELNSKIEQTKEGFKNFFASKPNAVKEAGDGETSALLPNVLSCVRGIYYNTNKLVDQGFININLSTEAIKNLAIGFGQQIGKVDFSKLGSTAQGAYDKAAAFVKDTKASSILGRLGDFISNNVGAGIKGAYNGAIAVGKGVYGQAKRLSGFVSEEAGNIFDKSKLAALETFDVYVDGEKEPRMIALKIRQGYYIDFLKQSPVRTRKDVKDAIGGITENQTDGSIEFVLQGSELEKAYFVNTHKSAIERVLVGGINSIKGGVKGIFNNIVNPSFKGALSVMGKAKNLALKLIDQPIDIYLKSDPSKCVMLAKLMRDGVYRDHLDGTFIDRPGKIKGAVYDVIKKEIVVSLDDFREGLVDINGNNAVKSNMALLGGVAGAALGAGAASVKWSLGKLSKLPGVLGGLAKSGADKMSALAKKLGVPSFTLGNFFGTQAVDILKDIKDILMYQAGLAGAPVLSAAGVAGKATGAVKSMVGSNIDNIKQSFANSTFSRNKETKNVNEVNQDRESNVTEVPATGNLFNSLGGVAIGGLGSFMSLLGGKKKKATATDGSEPSEEKESKLSKLSETLKNFGDKLKGKKTQPVDAVKRSKIINKDGKAVTEDGLRVGSWQEKEKNAKNVNKEIIRDKSAVKVYATKNIFSMIADVVGGIKDKVSDWLSSKGDPEDLADALSGNGKETAAERRKRRMKRAKGLGRKKGIGRILGKGGDILKSGYGVADAASKGILTKGGTAIGKGASALGRAGSMVGGAAMGAAKFGIGMLPKPLRLAGTAYAGYSAYQNFKEGNYGAAAVDAGLGALGVASTFGGLGGAAALAGTVGAGALAFLTSPITLTALALGGLAYGGYKLYQYATRKEFNFTEVMRMLEYGLRGKETENMRTLHKLELYLESVSTTSNEVWAIDDKKFKVDEIYDIFDIDSTDEKRKSELMQWFVKRFKPVFSKWKLIVKNVGDSDKINWLEKASNPKLLEVYKGFKLDQNAYSVGNSPFKEIVINTDSSVIENFKNVWLSSLKDKAKTDKDNTTGRAVAALGAAEVAAAKEQKANEKAKLDPNKNSGRKVSNIKELSNIANGKNSNANPPKETTANALGITDEVEDKTYSDNGSTSTAPPKQTTYGAVSSLANAGGDLFTGANGIKNLNLAKGANLNGLHPSVKRLFLGMVEEYNSLTGKNIQVNAAFRSFDEQAALFKKYGPGKAARPGASLHEFGLALDVQSTDLDVLDKMGLLRKYGFTRPLGSEPWHLEPAGIHDSAVRQKAKKNADFATAFIEAGVGRGGGGLGSRGRKGDLTRDDAYAKSLFDASSSSVKTANADATAAPPTSTKPPESSADKPKEVGASKGSAQSAAMILGLNDDAEPKDGKSPGTAGASASIKASNDNTMSTSRNIADQKGEGGSYSKLPESKGDGWENNKDMLLAAAKMVGIDPAVAAAIAAKESSLKTGAQGINGASGNSRAKGLFQFMPGTWSDMMRKYGAKYGIDPNTSPLDPRANALLGMEYVKGNLNKGGGDPSQAYLGHFLGAGGFSRFKGLKDGDIAANSFSAAAANNPNMFYKGGDKNRPYTKSEMLQNVQVSLNKNLRDFNVPLSLTETALASNVTKPSAVDVASIKTDQVSPTSSVTKPTIASIDKDIYKSSDRNPNISMVSMSSNAPVSSSVARAPVLDNNNNGTGRLEKVSVDQLTEQKTTNAILTEIRDLLSKSYNAASTRQPEAVNVNAVSEQREGVRKAREEPKPLPSSYVQRYRT